MNRPITILLSLVVLAHALLGCCCHHVHAVEMGGAAACNGHDHGHHKHGHDHSHSSKGDKCPSKPCDEESCVFIRGDVVNSVALHDSVAICTSFVTIDNLDQESLRIAGCAHLVVDDLRPPTRLHLLHQILLI